MVEGNIGNLREQYEFVSIGSAEFAHACPIGDPADFDFVLTGYPRNDAFHRSAVPKCVISLRQRYGQKRWVMYMPSHRDSVPGLNNRVCPGKAVNLFAPYGFDLRAVETAMEKTDSLLLIKLHPLEAAHADEFVERVEQSQYVHFFEPADQFADVYEVLPFVDVLITDYSSVYFDYLLTERAVVFAAFDFEPQKGKVPGRRLKFGYASIAAGPVVKSWPKLLEAVVSILGGQDRWAATRAQMNKRFNTHPLAGSSYSKRVVDEVLGRLAGRGD